MQNLIKSIVSNLRYPYNQLVSRSFHAVNTEVSVGLKELPVTPWSLSLVRTNIRNHFPRPREVKRYKVHSYWFRLRTTNGKKIIMRRILKGRHELSPGW